MHGIQRICLVAMLASLAMTPGQLAGQARAGMADDLGEIQTAIEAARADFRPYPPGQVTQARERLERAMAQLEPYFSKGTAENTARWKEYLQWELLKSELSAAEGPTLSRWGPILSAYFRNYAGLEHPYFVEMRSALLDFRAGYGMAHNANLQRLAAAQLDVLAQQLPQYDTEPTTELAGSIGNALRLLEMARQAPEVIQLVRAHYGRPNLYATVSQRLVNTGLGVDVRETETVSDCILGTHLVGTAQMTGQTAVQLIDQQDQAHLQLDLDGVITSDNVGYNRSVRVFSQGVTQVDGRVHILVDAQGVAAGKAQVHCDTDSTIDAICTPSHLVTRIAWKQARKSKGKAERIGSQHAEERVAEKMNQRADDLLAQVRETYDQRFRNPLIRRNEFPEDLTFRTQSGRMDILWRQANSGQLGAADLPEPLEGEQDLGVQVHESFVANFSRAMLAGVRLSDERLVEILQKNEMVVPEKLTAGDSTWAITFSSRQPPVSCSFTQNQIRFAIGGRQFESGETVVAQEMELSAVYQLEPTAQGMRFVRQGDVSARYLDPNVKGSDEVVIKVVMREKFEALFTPVIEFQGIQLPGRWADGAR